MIGGSESGETKILIDDREFTMDEFGRILSVFEGWGMRIIIVPDDETHQSPPIEIKDPDTGKEATIALSAAFNSDTEH